MFFLWQFLQRPKFADSYSKEKDILRQMWKIHKDNGVLNQKINKPQHSTIRWYLTAHSNVNSGKFLTFRLGLRRKVLFLRASDLKPKKLVIVDK